MRAARHFAQSLRGARLRARRWIRAALASGVAMAAVAAIPAVASATTTTVQLSASVRWITYGFGTYNNGMNCSVHAELRFAASPGAFSYKASVTDVNGVYGTPGATKTFNHPPDAFYDSYQTYYGGAQYQYYGEFDAPAGSHQFALESLDDTGGAPQDCTNYYNQNSGNFSNPHAEASRISWVASGQVGEHTCDLSGCHPAGVGGVKVTATGTAGNGDPANGSATSDSQGHWSMTLPQGSYTISPQGKGWNPVSKSVDLTNDTGGIAFERTADQVTLSVDPGTVFADGRGVVTVTATDRDADGNPVPNKELQIEPPVTYDVPVLVCDPNRNLVSPIRLQSSHDLIGAHFNRFTDDNGQVRFTMFVGAVPGDIIVEAGETDQPRIQWDSKFLTVGTPGAGASLPFDLPATLISQGDSNLAAGGEVTLLRWLGSIKAGGALGGIGFMPIHARDATAAHKLHDGVVLFPENQSIKQQLFSYLDGKTNTPPGETQAQVIDVDNLYNWEFGQLAAGHVGHSIQDHLQSLVGWRDGETVNFGENARGQDRKLAIPGRGRPLAGFANPPRGNGDLLYEYGPYPPFGADQQTANIFDHCVSPGFQGTTVFVHSPLSVVVHDAHGHKAGVTANGKPADTLSGAVVSFKGKRVRSIFVPSGSYTIDVVGTGQGPATLVIASGKKTEVFSFQVAKGQKGTLKIKSGHLPKVLTFGGQTVSATSGLGLSVKGLPKTLKRGKATTLKLTIRDQFGAFVRGVALKLKGPAGANDGGLSNRKGKITLAVRPLKAGKVTANFSGIGYRALTLKLRVP